MGVVVDITKQAILGIALILNIIHIGNQNTDITPLRAHPSPGRETSVWTRLGI